MKLTQHHRSALIDALLDAEHDKKTVSAHFNSKHSQPTTALNDGFEIDGWLAEIRINAIKSALINDEIDY